MLRLKAEKVPQGEGMHQAFFLPIGMGQVINQFYLDDLVDYVSGNSLVKTQNLDTFRGSKFGFRPNFLP